MYMTEETGQDPRHMVSMRHEGTSTDILEFDS